MIPCMSYCLLLLFAVCDRQHVGRVWGAETFELVYPEKKFRLLSEHVRTPISLACALANKRFSKSLLLK